MARPKFRLLFSIKNKIDLSHAMLITFNLTDLILQRRNNAISCSDVFVDTRQLATLYPFTSLRFVFLSCAFSFFHTGLTL